MILSPNIFVKEDQGFGSFFVDEILISWVGNFELVTERTLDDAMYIKVMLIKVLLATEGFEENFITLVFLQKV